MLDLFFPPAVNRRAVSRVHRIEPEPVIGDLPMGRERTERPRLAYERVWHIKNRERRLAVMKARYEAKKQEYKDKAKAWAKANPAKAKAIKDQNNHRKTVKRQLARILAHE